MTSMIGVWKSDPTLTTGHDDVGQAMGMTKQEIEETRNDIHTLHLTCEGDEWRMKVDIDNKGTWFDNKFRLDVPFNWEEPDKTKNTSVISLRNGHFIEKMTSEKNGVVRHFEVDMCRDGDLLILVVTINGISEVSKLRKI